MQRADNVVETFPKALDSADEFAIITAIMPLTDFPDSFSPMLVKDLRSLLKSSKFVKVFITLQLFLTLLVGLQIFGVVEREFNWFFWAIILLFCLGTLRECSFIESQDTGKNMELIKISGISPWQIVFGKWCSANLLLLLIVTSILPYLVFRYFSGTAELVHDLTILFFLSATLAALSAFSLGFSTSESPGIRGLMLLVILVGSGSIIGEINFGNSVHIAGVCLLLAFLTLYSLHAGAARFEESSKIHSIIKRGIMLLCGLIILILSLIIPTGLLSTIILIMIFSFGIIESLGDPTPRLEVALAPFANVPMKKIFAQFLTPGWPSTLLLACVCLFIVLLNGRFSESILNIAGGLLFASSFIVIPLCITYWLSDKINLPTSLVFIGGLIVYSFIMYDTVLFFLNGSFDGFFHRKSLPALSVIICTFALPFIIGRKWYTAINCVLSLQK